MDPYDQDRDSFLPDHTDDHYLNAMFDHLAQGRLLSPATWRRRRLPPWRQTQLVDMEWGNVLHGFVAGPLPDEEVLVTKDDINRASDAIEALLKNEQVRATGRVYRGLKAAHSMLNELWGLAHSNERATADDAKTPVMLDET